MSPMIFTSRLDIVIGLTEFGAFGIPTKRAARMIEVSFSEIGWVRRCVQTVP